MALKLSGFNTQRGEKINHGNNRAQQKDILIPQLKPDKTAGDSDANGKDVINAHAHRQCLRNIFGIDRYFLEVSRPRHAHRHQKLIKNVTSKCNKHRRSFRKYFSGKTIADADEYKHYRLRSEN